MSPRDQVKATRFVDIEDVMSLNTEGEEDRQKNQETSVSNRLLHSKSNETFGTHRVVAPQEVKLPAVFARLWKSKKEREDKMKVYRELSRDQ
jgi:hypothetical protein